MLMQVGDPFLTEALLDERYVRRLYAEGDSWFSAGGFLNGNLLDALDTLHEDWLIVSGAYPGDELIDMAQLADGDFKWMLMSADGMPAWDALLLSGGGNDLIAQAANLVGPHGIDSIELHRALSRIAAALDEMIAAARDAQRNIPVFLHSYDYPWPVRSDPIWIVGPWLGPAFAAAKLPPELWEASARTLINGLHAALDEVARSHPNVSLIDARGTLARPPRGWWSPITSDWANEIHPSARGYSRHAAFWSAALGHQFPTPAITKGTP